MIRSAAAMAAWQAFPAPIVTVVHELYDVGLTPVALSNTPAFKYMLARIASTAPFVMRPLLAAGHVTRRRGRAAVSSAAMNRNTESRGAFARAAISVVVAIGTPPKASIRM